MNVTLFERKVERYHVPSNRSIDCRIKKQGKVYKGNLEFKNRPIVGDILILNSEKGKEKYVIVNVIFNCFCENEENKSYLVDNCICEVVKYREKVIQQNGSDTFTESKGVVSFLDDWED